MQKDLLVLNKNFSEINPVVAGWEECEKGHAFGPAIREYYLIHFVISGKGIFQRNNRMVTLEKNSLFLIRPHEMTFYQADPDEPWQYIWVGFEGNLIEELLQFTDLKDDVSTLYAPYLRDLFISIKAAEHLHTTTEIFLCGKLFEMFSMLQEAHIKKNELTRSSSGYIKYAQDYLKANYATPIKISKLAQMLGIDRRYLCRIFVRETGETPQGYLINIRLKKAAELLRTGLYTVGEVARSSGYEDIYNFSKMFKKRYGLSPSSYKQGVVHGDGSLAPCTKVQDNRPREPIMNSLEVGRDDGLG